MPGFYFNQGMDVGLRDRGQLSNTVLLGSLLMETMLREVRELCNPHGNHDWTKKSHQQVTIASGYESLQIPLVLFTSLGVKCVGWSKFRHVNVCVQPCVDCMHTYS